MFNVRFKIISILLDLAPMLLGIGDGLHRLKLVRTVAAPKVTHLKLVRR